MLRNVTVVVRRRYVQGILYFESAMTRTVVFCTVTWKLLGFPSGNQLTADASAVEIQPIEIKVLSRIHILCSDASIFDFK